MKIEAEIRGYISTKAGLLRRDRGEFPSCFVPVLQAFVCVDSSASG